MSLLGVAFAGCDTLIADRMVIRTPADQLGQLSSTPDILAAARMALNDCGLAESDTKAIGNTLAWRDPRKPPGFRVMVHPVDDGLRVTLAQDLHGPIGPTDSYGCVRKSLRSRLEERYGKQRANRS